MSQWVSFTLLPAEEFNRLQADPSAISSRDGEKFTLHTLWYNFHELFRDEQGPLRFIILGDIAERPIEPSLGLIEGGGDDADGTYFAWR